MFNNLPQVKQASLEAFVDSKDFGVVIERLNEHIDSLRRENPCLVRAIEGSAATAVELDCLEFIPRLKEILLANCIVATLLVLQIVDRELESMKLEKAFGPIKLEK